MLENPFFAKLYKVVIEIVNILVYNVITLLYIEHVTKLYNEAADIWDMVKGHLWWPWTHWPR